jgi:hypothetical protein
LDWVAAAALLKKTEEAAKRALTENEAANKHRASPTTGPETKG